RPRIARVCLLLELVVARLGVRPVHHTEPAVVLAHPGAEIEPRNQERRQHEARALAALVAHRAVHVRAGRRARPSGPRRAVVASALDGGALVEGPARDADTVLTGRERAGGDGEGRGVCRTRLRDAARVDPRGLPARARDSAAEGVVGADGEAVL